MVTALYRRYRPESFADVIGQDHVTVPLMRALRAGRIGHAYLFSGPRGCGKTTSARILARCLNCAEGPTDTPCGQCDSCRELARGGSGSLDVVEIDAASHGGVDDARELRERAAFAPVRDRFKVFIIDEAHMVTSAGFNALLKLVEEPPEHVKFVFATTEPEKVIGTIRSRTHHYPFRLIPPQILTPYLEEICAAEAVPVGEGVLPLVVRAGGGSARDTLSVLDQLMAGAAEEGLDHQTAAALLGFTDAALLDDAIDAISRRDAGGLYAAVERVIASGQEPRRFVEDLLDRLRDLLVLSAVPERGEDLLPQTPADELARLRDAIQGFDPADLSRCGDLVHETLSTMSGATSPRLHLELLAARLVLRDERAQAGPVLAGPAPRGAAEGARAVPAAGQGGSGGAGGVTGRDRARRVAQEQAEAARRAREPQATEQRREDPDRRQQAPERPAASSQSQAQSPSRSQSLSSAQAPSASRPAAAAPAPAPEASADDGWGPVAPIGGGAPASGSVEGSSAPARPAEGTAAGEDRAAPMHGGVAPQTPEAPAEPASGTADRSGGSGQDLGAEEVRGHWSAILDELQQIRRPAWALVSQNAQVHSARGNTLVLGFRTEGLLAAFHRGTGAQNVADAVRRVMHRDVLVEGVVGEGEPGEGPAAGPRPGRDGGAGGASGPDGAPRGRAGAGREAPSSRSSAGPAQTQTGGPAPQGARDAAAARPPVEEDLPPEPDDPYGPEGPYGPSDPFAAADPGPSDPFAASTPSRSAGTSAASGPSAPRTSGASGEESEPPRVEPPAAPAASESAPVTIPDDSRDQVPDDQPRTHGQSALRAALAQGRPVRTGPRERSASIGSGAAASPSEEPVDEDPDAGAPSAAEHSGGGQEASQAVPVRSAAPAPEHSAASSAPAQDWERREQEPTTAQRRPQQERPPQDRAPERPRGVSGAALVREAALASRQAAPAARTASGAVSDEPEDPTGGAHRDDDDAQVTTRRPQLLVEQMLGGTVLEVIDESR